MQVAEKKLNCLKGTMRANMPNVGTIEGSVNASLKGGKKQISIDKEGNVIFWIVNDFDVTVTAEDIVDCKVASSGRWIMRGSNIKDGDTTITEYWYGTYLDLKFADGTTGRMGVKIFSVAGTDIWKPGFGDIPCVNGWLAPNGARDEHYDDDFCPENYTPNVEGYYKSYNKKNLWKKLDSILKLSERFPDGFENGMPKGSYVNDAGKSTLYVKKSD